MSLALVYSRANIGLEAPRVAVETHLSNGLPGFSIVGMPETAVRESKERVRSAIINSGLEFPAKRIIINLAPADLPKTGGRFDLAIAVGILLASRQVEPGSTEAVEFMGELALSGEVRNVNGLIPGLMACRADKHRCIVPAGNSAEASLITGIEVRACRHLLELCRALRGEVELPAVARPVIQRPQEDGSFDDIIGLHQARRALTIAAAGGHNLLMRGPPGTGKTMLANRMRTLLPPLTDQQALEVAALRSINSERVDIQDCYRVPFRAPHHTSSAVALVGGGKTPHCGEISLAHHGVLFLDELPEFGARTLEVLREPLESGCIVLSRASYQARLPASFQLLAAMNPCPCGHHGDPEKACRCSEEKIRSYQQRVSGPLLDRMDLHVEVPRLSREERTQLLAYKRIGEDRGPALCASIRHCRQRQYARSGKLNAGLDQAAIRRHCTLDAEAGKMLENAMQKLHLSTRAHFRILRVARTIADLCECRAIDSRHLLEAVNYRKFDRCQ